MQSFLDFGPRAHRVFRRGKLEECVDLKAGASPQRILNGDPARADVARAADFQRIAANLAALP